MKLFKHYLSRVFRPNITLAMTVLRSILCSMKNSSLSLKMSTAFTFQKKIYHGQYQEEQRLLWSYER